MRPFQLCCLLLLTPPCFAQLAYTATGSQYTQHFNELPASGSFSFTGKGPFPLNLTPLHIDALTGWQMVQTGGSQSNLQFGISTGSATSSGTYSYGLANNNNRSLGTIASGTGIYSFGLLLSNETGEIINQITLSFTAMQWRKGGSGNPNHWKFGYQTGMFTSILPDTTLSSLPTLDLRSIHSTTGAATLNATQPTNQHQLQATITNLLWLPGQQLILRWDDQDETGNDDAMAIDDFSFSGQQILGPPVILAQQFSDLHPSSALLSCIVNDQLAATSIQFETDHSPHFTNPKPAGEPLLMQAGSGPQKTEYHIADLSPNTSYYFRVKASNNMGITYSSPVQFTTPPLPPLVHLSKPFFDEEKGFACTVNTTTNGSPIIEKGITWSTLPQPSATDHHPFSTTLSSADTFYLNQLPEGTQVFIRAFASHPTTTGWSDVQSFFTPTRLQKFTMLSPPITRLDTIRYQITLQHPVPLDTSDILLETVGHGQYSIHSLSTNGNNHQLTIIAHEALGSVTPVIRTGIARLPVIWHAPFKGPTTQVDHHPPIIHSIMPVAEHFKIGDTAFLYLHCVPDKDTWALKHGMINNTPSPILQRMNDSCIAIGYTVREGMQDLTIQDPIDLQLVVTDPAGNENLLRSFLHPNQFLSVDANRPRIISFTTSPPKTYATGDTILVHLHSQEAISLDSSSGAPTLPITVGSRVKQATLYHASPFIHSFHYIVQAEEQDQDGIRIHNMLSLNQAIIADKAGNPLLNTIQDAGIMHHIIVDAITPVVTSVNTPPARTYGVNDTLLFKVNFSKPVFITDAIPAIMINHPEQTLFANMTEGNGTNQLEFRHIIKPNTMIRQSFSINNNLLHANIKDAAGNTANTTLKNMGALSNIRVDGIPPSFLTPQHTIATCMNKPIQHLQALLSTINTESGEQLQWDLLLPPLHGSLLGLPFGKRLNSTAHQPAQLEYFPYKDHTGPDSFLVAISDGANTNSSWFYLLIEPPITHNHIEKDTIICAGMTTVDLRGSIPMGSTPPYHYHWQTATNNNTPNFQTATGLAHFQNFTTPPFLQSMLARRIVHTKGCADTSDAVRIRVRTTGLWIGANKGHWQTSSNWCGALVPNEHTDVLINSGTVIADKTAICNSLHVQQAANLVVAGSLTISGPLTGHSNINAEEGTIITAGNDTLSLDARAFTHKTIGSLIIGKHTRIEEDSLYINHSLSIRKGRLQTNNRLILSPAAYMGANASGIEWNGMLTTRYLQNKNIPTLAIHPFREELTEQTQYTASPSFLRMNTGTQYLVDTISYTDGKLDWHLNNDEQYHKNWPAQKSRLTNTYQYNSLIYPGSKQEQPVNSLTGTPFTGSVSMNLPFTTDTSYYVTGNPYLSWVNLQRTQRSPRIGHHYWRWVDTIGENGVYLSTPFSTPAAIAPFEGFIIKLTDSTSHELIFTEESKLSSPFSYSPEMAITENTNQVKLALYKAHKLLDIFQLVGSDTARHWYDPADADKLLNPGSNLFSVTNNGHKLATDTRPFNASLHIPLGFSLHDTGTYHIKVLHSDLAAGYKLELADLLTNQKVQLQKDSLLAFSAGNDTAFDLRGRLVIRTPPLPPRPKEAITIKVFPVPATHSLQIQFTAQDAGPVILLIRDLHGRVLQQYQQGFSSKGSYEIPIAGLHNGKYLAELHCGKLVIGTLFLKL